jgi:uncharacterized membrane protein YozB (DUF420 family)
MEYVYWYWPNYISLAVMSLFVFGLLLFKKFVKLPKGLVVSSFISYVLLLICFLPLFGLQMPKTLMGICILVVTGPSFCVTGCIAALFNDGPASFLEGLKEIGLIGMSFCALNDASCIWRTIVDWVAFIINALAIFAIIRLFLYIRRKDSAKRLQAKQAV